MGYNFRTCTVVGLGVGIILTLALSSFAADWYGTSWKYRQKITVSSSIADSDQSNFPLLIKITDQNNLLFSNTQPDGEDILFTDSDGTTKLSHEIETYSNTGTKILECWVKIPTLSSSSNTIIYMYYGNFTCDSQENPTGVWDSNYVGVWHSKDASTTTIADSTLNANTGTKKAVGEPVEADGKIGKAESYDGTNDYVNCGNNSSLNFVAKGNYTWSAWLNLGQLGVEQIFIFKIGASGGYLIKRTNSNYVKIAQHGWAGVGESSFTLPLNTWTHIVVVHNGTNNQQWFYKNGVEGTSYYGANTFADDASTSLILSYEYYFKGLIDEVRISNVARSAAWIAAEYRNQSSPSTYLTFLGEENSPDDRGL